MAALSTVSNVLASMQRAASDLDRVVQNADQFPARAVIPASSLEPIRAALWDIERSVGALESAGIGAEMLQDIDAATARNLKRISRRWAKIDGVRAYWNFPDYAELGSIVSDIRMMQDLHSLTGLQLHLREGGNPVSVKRQVALHVGRQLMSQTVDRMPAPNLLIGGSVMAGGLAMFEDLESSDGEPLDEKLMAVSAGLTAGGMSALPMASIGFHLLAKGKASFTEASVYRIMQSNLRYFTIPGIIGISAVYSGASPFE